MHTYWWAEWCCQMWLWACSISHTSKLAHTLHCDIEHGHSHSRWQHLCRVSCLSSITICDTEHGLVLHRACAVSHKVTVLTRTVHVWCLSRVRAITIRDRADARTLHHRWPFLSSLQAPYDGRTIPEPILSVHSRTMAERYLNQSYRSANVQLWFTFIAEPWLNDIWTNLSVRPPFGYGSHKYVRIRSHFGSAEPILNQKGLQGLASFGCLKKHLQILVKNHPAPSFCPWFAHLGWKIDALVEHQS